MAVVSELIRANDNGTISFGDYTKDVKQKKSDFEVGADLYKVKTFCEVTKLERNELFVYESVPGTAVNNFDVKADLVTFEVEGPEDASITLELAPDTEYMVNVDGADTGVIKTKLGGKISFSLELDPGVSKKVSVKKV